MVARSESRRATRVAEAIREEVASLLVREVRNAELARVTVTGATASADLKLVRVYFVTADQDDLERTSEALARTAPFLQGEIGRRLKLRHTPKLVFALDRSLGEGERIDELLREVHEAEADGAPETPESALARLVAASERILIAVHRNPDGDAVGCLLGLARMLRLLGKRPVAFCPDGIPKVLMFLPGAAEAVRVLDADAAFDLTISLDTASEDLLPEGFPAKERRGVWVVIDHHVERDRFGDIVIRRADAAAVGEILYALSKELVWPLDTEVAECLYASIAADTGSFRYASTTPTTHRIAADLIAEGARPWAIATALFESYPLHRQRLLADVLKTLELFANGRLALLSATPEMLAAVGAAREDLEGMVNLGRAVGSVEIAALLRLEPNGDVKASFRSKGRVDVGELAARFGGGGHINAAGCTLRGTSLAEAREKICAAVEEFLAGRADAPSSG